MGLSATFVNTYSKVAHCKLYAIKTPITAADILNGRVLPFFESNEMGILRMLTDRGTEFYGKVEQHDHELYLAVNDILSTQKQMHIIHKQMEFVNGFTKQFYKNFIKLLFVKRFILHLTNCKKISMIGLLITTMSELIKEKCAVGERQWKHFLMAKKIWRERVDSLNLD